MALPSRCRTGRSRSTSYRRGEPFGEGGGGGEVEIKMNGAVKGIRAATPGFVSATPMASQKTLVRMYTIRQISDLQAGRSLQSTQTFNHYHQQHGAKSASGGSYQPAAERLLTLRQPTQQNFPTHTLPPSRQVFSIYVLVSPQKAQGVCASLTPSAL